VTYEFRIDGQPPPLNASRMLDEYLSRTGGAPRDAVSQLQVTMLRELLSVLEVVLADELVPRGVALRVLRGLIYGGRPHISDEEYRMTRTREMTEMLMRQPVPLDVQSLLNLPPQ
jgi:hypothetical protein